MRFVVSVLVAVCLLGRPGHADRLPTISESIAEIAQLETALEYASALNLATHTIARGEATRDQLASLHLIAGRLAAGLDHPDEAQAHFARVLALRPETVLVTGTSPKLQAPFDAAKATAVPLSADLFHAGNRAVVTVRQDPLKLIVGVRVEVEGNVVTESRALEVVVAATRRPITISALDEYGNVLVTRVDQAPLTSHGVRPPLYAHWGTYAAITGVALVAAGVAAWRYEDAQDQFDRGVTEGSNYTALRAIEQRGQRWALGADVGFGIAALTGVTAVLLFATRPHDVEHVVITSHGVGYVATF